MNTKIQSFILNPRVFFTLVLCIAGIITAQTIIVPPPEVNTTIPITSYNNYVIFKQSFFHLIHNQDLYIAYPNEFWDLYKYSPAFSLLIAPFALMPDWLGLFFWNLLNIGVLYAAIYYFPIPGNKKLLASALILIEAITSIQNSQSNCLIAGLILFAFLAFEKDQIAKGTLFITLCVFIKLFGIVAYSMILLYPKKSRAIIYTFIWTAVLSTLPLLAVTFDQLIALYTSWGHMLSNDHNGSFGISLMGILNSWFGLGKLKTTMPLFGAIVFMIPFIKTKNFDNATFRINIVCSILLWIILFNHKSESPTFVIAVSAAAIWYFTNPFSKINLTLIILTLILTVLSPTDIFPRSIRDQYIIPYALKALPCLLIWLKLTYDLLLFKPIEFAKNE